jgi:hypothetical protein
LKVDPARREGVQISVEATTMQVQRCKKGVGMEPAVWITVRVLARRGRAENLYSDVYPCPSWNVAGEEGSRLIGEETLP